jgi:hypothetical protein
MHCDAAFVKPPSKKSLDKRVRLKRPNARSGFARLEFARWMGSTQGQGVGAEAVRSEGYSLESY